MLVKRWKEPFARLLFRSDRGAAHAHPCFDKSANQPRPNRTLMINRVSRTRVALIMRRVSGFAGRKRAQTQRRKQKHFHGIDNTTRFFLRQQHERQSANREDLVRAESEIDYARLMVAVDHVSEVASMFIPELGFERRTTFFEQCLPWRGKFRTDRERV